MGNKKMSPANDQIKKSKHYATQAHKRIRHKRKYTNQPYDIHLKAVAELVSTVTDDPEMIAAAWLHDTVEDTPVTFHDIEREFGAGTAQLVSDLTDVSKASDGNRAVRKAIDRAHLAQAMPRAKTIKLADLIDNCRDICSNNLRFARVFLTEMAALLEVLGDGDAELFAQARQVLSDCAASLQIERIPILLQGWDQEDSAADKLLSHQHAQLQFITAFTAKDIAEPLRSFDGEQSGPGILQKMEELNLFEAGVRIDGFIDGYVLPADLCKDTLTKCMRQFRKDQVLDGDASLSEVIHVLTRHTHCFVSLLGSVAGVITRSDIQKPIVRMWLFGMITLIEMNFAERIRMKWEAESWSSLISSTRLSKAKELLEERRRRKQKCDLLDCLQFSDKARIIIEDPEELEYLGFNSKRIAKQISKELQSLRNNLAHSQDIITHDWPQIARLAKRFEKILSR
jgi:hypothetical protein